MTEAELVDGRRDAPAPSAPRRRSLDVDEPSELPTTVAGTLLLLYLAGLALFDQAFARLSIPGVPIYASEIVLAVGVLYLVGRHHPFRGVRTGRFFSVALLVVYLAWGLIRFMTSLQYPILDVVRDSALVYYALFAVVAIGLSGFDRRFKPEGLIQLFSRFVPWLFVVAPIRILGAIVLVDVGPVVPGTDIGILWGHRLGNLAVFLAVAVLYLATCGRRDRRTIIGIVGGICLIVVIGTQTRGGLLAAMATIAIALVIWNRSVRLRLGWVLAVAGALFVLAWGLNLQIPAGTRDISVTQLTANISAVFADGGGRGAEGQASATIAFREDLWNAVLRETVATGRIENGWGFGPNLGSAFLPGHVDTDLRQPHNSHVTVLTRLGIVGMVIWVGLWATWLYTVLARARRSVRTRRLARDPAGHMALLAAAGVVGILVNAYFDPTLETPMAAVWLWCLFGFGVLSVASRTRAGTPPDGPVAVNRSAASAPT